MARKKLPCGYFSEDLARISAMTYVSIYSKILLSRAI